MNRVVQAILYGLFAVCVGYFSIAPTYRYADPHVAVIKLSLSHAAQRVKECVKLTPQQINERAVKGEPLNDCERERRPVSVELEIDGATALRLTALPSGLWGDGPASVYERLNIAAGPHTITARLRDSADEDGWDYEHTENVNLIPGRYFTITFRAETGGFAFR
ncbi:MAG: hypothetical protein OEU53_06270 [Gammaproteobacteria bacterium]|jgi:hypothetical protein|nr:hypothetical protein [Gammaproteobacteria bacterium]